MRCQIYIVTGTLLNHLTGTTVAELDIVAFRWIRMQQKQTNKKAKINKQTYAESNAALKTLFNQSAMMSATHNKQTNKSECNEVGELAPDTQPTTKQIIWKKESECNEESDTQITTNQTNNQTNNIKPNQSAMRRAGYNPTHNEVLDIINRLIISNLVCLVYNSLYHLPLQAWRRERSRLSGHPWRPRFQGEEVFFAGEWFHLWLKRLF